MSNINIVLDKMNKRLVRVLMLIVLCVQIQLGLADNGVLIDPTHPPISFNADAISNTSDAIDAQIESSSQLRLYQILSNNGKKAAIINNVLVKEGDQIENNSITRINTYSVTLTQDNQEITLPLFHGK